MTFLEPIFISIELARVRTDIVMRLKKFSLVDLGTRLCNFLY